MKEKELTETWKDRIKAPVAEFSAYKPWKTDQLTIRFREVITASQEGL